MNPSGSQSGCQSFAFPFSLYSKSNAEVAKSKWRYGDDAGRCQHSGRNRRADRHRRLTFELLIAVAAINKQTKQSNSVALPARPCMLATVASSLPFTSRFVAATCNQCSQTQYVGEHRHACIGVSTERRCGSLPTDLVRRGDPGLGEPTGLLQFLRAFPTALPAPRVADAHRTPG